MFKVPNRMFSGLCAFIVWVAAYVMFVSAVISPKTGQTHRVTTPSEIPDLNFPLPQSYLEESHASDTLSVQVGSDDASHNDKKSTSQTFAAENVKTQHFYKARPLTERRRIRNRENKKAQRARMSKEEKSAMYKKDHEGRKRKSAEVRNEFSNPLFEYLLIGLSLSTITQSKEAAQRYKEISSACTRRWKERKVAEKEGKEVSPENALRRPSTKTVKGSKLL